MKGAYKTKTGKYISMINYGKDGSEYLGTFNTEIEAHKAFMKAREATPRKPKSYKITHSKPLVHDGVEYNSIAEMARTFHTSSAVISYYLKHDKPFAGEYIDYL